MAAAMLWYARLPADSAPWKAAIETPSTLIPPLSTLTDILPSVLLFGVGISMVVAPLTSALMSSIPGRFSGLGSAINNSISRVGQPLLGAIIFIADQRDLLRQPGDESARSRHDGRGRSPRLSAAQSGAGDCDAGSADGGDPGLDRRLPHGDVGHGRVAGDRWAGLLVRAARGCHEGHGLTHPATPRDWDAQTYDQVADPQTRWGRAVLDRLPLAGDERVLDAGCGTGRVTELLAARLPRGRIVALDGSPSMIEAARRRLAVLGDRVEYVVADLGLPLPLDEPVDAILSTATFHWIADHDALFANLAAVLRPGGWLVAQCGGAGNIATIQAVLSSIGDGWLGPVNFATPMDTVRRLDAAGFVDIECWLSDEPTRLEPGRPFETFLRTVILGAHLERLPPAERDGFVHAVAERLPDSVIDYVRLNIVARRSSR